MTNWNGNSGPGSASPATAPVVLRSLGPIVATAIVVLFLLVSAIPLMHWFTEEGRLSTLADNRARWAELDITTYRWTLDYRLPGQVASTTAEIQVRDGVATPSQDETGPAPFATVDALFGYLEEAIRATPDALEVTYDEAYGFPRSVTIDPDQTLVNDETTLVISGFDPRLNPRGGELQ